MQHCRIWARKSSVALSVLAALAGCGGKDEAPAAAAGQAQVEGLRCSQPDSAGWCWQHPLVEGQVFYNVDFVDSQWGWLFGSAGAMRTVDGGVSWQPHAVPGWQRPLFADARRGWVVGPDGLWQTQDGGTSWRALSLPFAARNSYLQFAAPQTLVIDRAGVAGQSGPVVSMVSEDGGNTWHPAAETVGIVESNGVLWREGRPNWRKSLDLGRTFVSETAWPTFGSELDLRFRPDGWAWRQGTFYDSTQRKTVNELWVRAGHTAAWRQMALPNLEGFSVLTTAYVGPSGAWLRAFGLTDNTYTLWRADAPFAAWAPTVWPLEPATSPATSPAPATSRLAASEIQNAAMVDDQTFWLQRKGNELAAGALQITTDGGKSWLLDAHPQRLSSDQVQSIQRDGAGGLVLSYDGGSRGFRSVDNGRSWRALPKALPTDADEAIDDVVFLDANRGLAVSGRGLLLDTQDGGRQWRSRHGVDGLPAAHMRRGGGSYGYIGQGWARGQLLHAADGSVWMVASGKISVSRDQGRTWKPLPFMASETPLEVWEPMRLLRAQDGRLLVHAWSACTRTGVFPAAGIPTCTARLAQSDDNGLTWTWLPGVWNHHARIVFTSNREGLRSGCGTTLYRTVDGGQHWTRVYEDNAALERWFTYGYCHDVSQHHLLVDAHRVWAVFDYGRYSSTDSRLTWQFDGGKSWPPQTADNLPMTVHDITFADARRGWVVGPGGTVMRTDDGGQTWARQDTGTVKNLRSVYAGSPRSTWIGGVHNSLLATRTAGQ